MQIEHFLNNNFPYKEKIKKAILGKSKSDLIDTLNILYGHHKNKKNNQSFMVASEMYHYKNKFKKK